MRAASESRKFFGPVMAGLAGLVTVGRLTHCISEVRVSFTGQGAEGDVSWLLKEVHGNLWFDSTSCSLPDTSPATYFYQFYQIVRESFGILIFLTQTVKLAMVKSFHLYTEQKQAPIASDSIIHSDKVFDIYSFDLPSPTLHPADDCEIDLSLSLPDPQPFRRSKNPMQHDGVKNINLIRACKAATGMEISADEPGKWTSGSKERQESVARMALLFCRSQRSEPTRSSSFGFKTLELGPLS